MATGTITKPITNMKMQSVTLPFTPPSNGLLLCELRLASTNGRGYITYSGTWPALIDGYNTASSFISGTLFVTKGVTVSQGEVSNVQTVNYRFISLD